MKRGAYISFLKKYIFSAAVLRIRNKSFGSCFGSGSGLKLVSDPDPDPDPDPNPDSDPDLDQKLAKFFYTNIFTQPHLQGSPLSAL
jgi:hypothetical protein